MKDIVIKTRKGFERDDGSARYLYDHDGKYLGQYQPDMLSDYLSVGELWLETYPGDSCFHELTPDQMASAT